MKLVGHQFKADKTLLRTVAYKLLELTVSEVEEMKFNSKFRKNLDKFVVIDP